MLQEGFSHSPPISQSLLSTPAACLPSGGPTGQTERNGHEAKREIALPTKNGQPLGELDLTETLAALAIETGLSVRAVLNSLRKLEKAGRT